MKEIKEIIKELEESGITRPRYEWEISNTYPISILPSWKPYNKKDIELAFNDIPNHPAKIYVHIPFCTNRCKYCFYNTNIGKNTDEKRDYVNYLKKEINLVLSRIKKDVQADSFYFGGGTPTSLDSKLLLDLFMSVKNKFHLISDYTWTIETSPETINDEKLELFKEFGVNRISMGVQSLDDSVLKAIRRSHDSNTAIKSIERILSYDFSIFNIDLIYGLPYQSLKSWKNTLNKVVDLQVPELTLYHLRINPLASLKNYKVDLEKELSMFSISSDILEGNGYIRVRPHHWILGEYLDEWKKYKSAPTSDQRLIGMKKGFVLGFGTSAISHIGDYLYYNKWDLNEYYRSIDDKELPIEKEFILKKEDKISRFFINQLVQGMKLDLDEYKRFFGERIPKNILSNIDKLIKLGLVERDKDILRMSEKGLLVFDFIERSFYPMREYFN